MKCRLLVGLLLVLAACSEPQGLRLDDHHTLGAPVTVSNLTVWPVFTDRPLDLGEFLTLPEALAEGLAEVREADQGGRVNRLVLENKADLPILVCAGTVVTGGQQDRQIGQDLVVRAKATTPVDAFCVEQGRWSPSRAGVRTDGKFLGAEGVALRSVRSAAQYELSQDLVWQRVAEVREDTFNRLQVDPNPGAVTIRLGGATRADRQGTANVRLFSFDSSSLAVVMDATNAAAGPELAKYVDAVREHFAAQEGCIGFAYALNGEPVTVRTFAHPRVFRQQFAPYLKVMATEALLAADQPAREARGSDIVALVRGIAAADEQVRDTAGLNRNGIQETDAAFHSSCYVERDGKGWVALTRDWTARR